MVVEIKATTTAKDKPKPIKKASNHLGLGAGKEKEFIIENLAMLLASGLGLVTAIESIKSEIKSKPLKAKLDELVTNIDKGNNLWRSLEISQLFSADTISIIRIGEESGRLPENLQVIALQQQKDRLFRSRLHSAMAYPLFVLTLTILIGLGMAWFILPNLANVLNNLKVKLPLITRVLIKFGLFLKVSGKVAVPLFLVGFVTTIYILFFYSKTRQFGRRNLSKLPGIGRLIHEVELARFGFVLGTLLKAGFTITQAFESLENSTKDPLYKKFYGHLKDNLAAGNSFAKSFELDPAAGKLLSHSVIQIVIAAEQSGNLDTALLTIGQRYEEKSEISSKNLTTLLEPIMLFVVWIGVMFMALSIILPIYSLIGGINP